MKTALTIAGSDSGGGAGIQADLKTFAAHGVYGTSAVTAITAQNTLGVTAWEAVTSDLVTAQIEAVASDFGVDAVKTGMLANAAIVEAVGAAIASLDLPRVVVDPVMVAKGGARLLDDEAIEAMKAELLPRAFVVTPNVFEASALAGMPVRNARRGAGGGGTDCRARCRRGHRQGGPPPYHRRDRRILRRPGVRRAASAANRDAPHAWHGLHVFVGDCSQPGAGAAARRRRGTGEGVCHRRNPAGARSGRRARAAGSFPGPERII